MQISAGVSVKLAGLTMTSGRAAQGGAIDNAGNLIIQSSLLVNNQAVGTHSDRRNGRRDL